MENRKDWIDFNLVKGSVSMEMLIIHLGIAELSRTGDEVRLRCPFHAGKSGNSMAVNLVKNTFYCFGCKARGNVLDFVAKRENCSVKDAALKLNDWFEIDKVNGSVDSNPNHEREVINNSSLNNSQDVQSVTPAEIIGKIEFELSRLKALLGEQKKAGEIENLHFR